MNDDTNIDLGLCCECELRDASAIVMLNRRAPIPGKGWGCLVCDLPNDGAIAVACDACSEALLEQNPRLVCVGHPRDNLRLPFDNLPEGVFDHDLEKHPEQER